MKKIALFLLMLCTYSTVTFGWVVIPKTDSTAYSGWADGAAHVAYIAAGVGCTDDASATTPDNLCTTPNVIGQAFCTTQYWAKQDLDISTAPASGDGCWCRRTHVRTDGNLMLDVGPWFLIGIESSAANCETNCPENCARALSNVCNTSLGSILFLSSPHGA